MADLMPATLTTNGFADFAHDSYMQRDSISLFYTGFRIIRSEMIITNDFGSLKNFSYKATCMDISPQPVTQTVSVCVKLLMSSKLHISKHIT
ncbi:hypothetical protein PoB_003171800 [Plakobranchus ocellatus]|uniref:Uncharacterized protein n=1 Tax=Plakobranchus ocellatus TaxID=259542 RepID=A0AAV4AD82_9GAST|nr:hypothetical protein PoB_003171800 [Plakobranchus ocellatus]